MSKPLAIRITAEFNVLLARTFVPVAETRISIFFLAIYVKMELNNSIYNHMHYDALFYPLKHL